MYWYYELENDLTALLEGHPELARKLARTVEDTTPKTETGFRVREAFSHAANRVEVATPAG